MSNIIIGKYTLESLSIGMYSDPFTIFREYVQNSSDSIDRAIELGIINQKNSKIEIMVDQKNKFISIKDNGTGIDSINAFKVLGDVGNSQKNYREDRGFRGIGRLGGLGYSEQLKFITSYKGENKKTIITWNCNRLKDLLMPSNAEAADLISVINAVTTVEIKSESKAEHYFEVQLINVDDQYSELLEKDEVKYYLEVTAPIPFDATKFREAPLITSGLKQIDRFPEQYNIFLNNYGICLMKQYSSSVKTTSGNKSKLASDLIREIKTISVYKEDGSLLYWGWYAITRFQGAVQDPHMRGIRLRKGNILIGGENTFANFFPSKSRTERETANSWFVGEIYIYDNDIIPNAKRDDFERNSAFKAFKSELNKLAGQLNSQYRRKMSELNSTLRNFENHKNRIDEINKQIENNEVTSDTKREQLLNEQKQAEEKIIEASKKLEKIYNNSTVDPEYADIVKKHIDSIPDIKKKSIELENKIINADYATKGDLSTSYSRSEKKIYQKVISVIDEYFAHDKNTAAELRKRILEELDGKKK